MLTSICLFMLKQRPAEIHHNLRKLCGDYLTFSPQTQGKNMLFFLKPSQGSIPLYIKKQKAPFWVHLFFYIEGKTNSIF